MSCDIEDTCVCRQDSACFDPTCSTCPTCVGRLTGLDDADEDELCECPDDTCADACPCELHHAEVN